MGLFDTKRNIRVQKGRETQERERREREKSEVSYSCTLLCYISLSYFHLEENGPKINNLCLTSNTIGSNAASNSHTFDPHVTWSPCVHRAGCYLNLL